MPDLLFRPPLPNMEQAMNLLPLYSAGTVSTSNVPASATMSTRGPSSTIPSTASSSSMGPNWIIQLGSTQPSVIRQGTAQDLHNGAQDHLSAPAPECLQTDSTQPVFRATHQQKRAHSPSPSSSKLSRYYEPEQSDESSDKEDLLNEPFDPDTFYASKQKTPKEIREYLDVRFRKHIEKDHRKMARDYPLPDTPAAHPPDPDGNIVDYLGKDFPHSSDKQPKGSKPLSLLPQPH